MPKSRAEIQKAYRQRLKEKNNDAYLRKERERNRRSYVPSSSLSDNDKKRRNELNREKLRRFYARKRQERMRNNEANAETSGYESGQADNMQERGRMTVRLPFQNNRKKGAMLRWRRELSEATSRIRLLEQDRKELVKKYRSTQRSLQRMKNKKPDGPDTPRRETEKIMHEARLDESQRQKIRKRLLLGNVMIGELKAAKEKTPLGSMKSLHRIISGKIVKKYRCAGFLAQKTGLSRHKLSSCDSKEHQLKKPTRCCTVRKNKSLIEAFMKREDNSRLKPGKADATRMKKGVKVQAYVLSDYLKNLYNKFKAENPTNQISFTSFFRSKPKYILTAAYSSANSCLCTKHQNAALIVKTIRRAGVDIPTNPEDVCKNMPSTDLLNQSLNDAVSLKQWKRVEVEEKGKKKFVTKIVESNLNKDEFILQFENQMTEFRGHVGRVGKQYEEVKRLKQNLPEHEMMIQLDFAENYSCRSMEEVQSAYFNQTMVTLHPIVAYYHEDDGSLRHQSFIIVSDEMGHKSSTVTAFINDIIPVLKNIDKNLKKLHYWSDSPTSQYRNKYIFDLIANHKELYGIEARWNYFEAGHGKGPCDGLGGTCKRLADEAMRSGKVVIQDAEGFYRWAIQSSMVNVQFRFVSSEQCELVQKDQEQKQVKPIKGTMKIHVVSGLGQSQVMTREVSCYCDVCLSGQTCDGWVHGETSIANTCKQKRNQNSKLTKSSSSAPLSQGLPEEDNSTLTESEQSGKSNSDAQETIKPDKPVYDTGEFVAALYEKNWYIGKVMEKDEDEYKISFMEPKKQLYQWPRTEDVIWIEEGNILCKISAPEGTGKSKRMFKMSPDDTEKVKHLFGQLN